jgi:hypothetical protein
MLRLLEMTDANASIIPLRMRCRCSPSQWPAGSRR